MPEMKNNFQKGRMNKDLDERLVPDGEYRDALNVEIATSNDSDMGTLQTLKGNTFLGGANGGVCIGSIADDKNDKLYFMVAGGSDMIIEYDFTNEVFAVVCVDNYSFTGHRALNFHASFLITGINIIDDLLFWTDNNSEPKRISIRRGKEGTAINPSHTHLMVRDVGYWDSTIGAFIEAAADEFVDSGELIQEQHLTVIKKGPPAAPVLEMIDTLHGDADADGEVGGDEMSRGVANAGTLDWLDSDGEFNPTLPILTVNPDPDGDTLVAPSGISQAGVDFPPGSFLNVYKKSDRTIKVRVKILGSTNQVDFECSILSGNKEIEGEEDLVVELEQRDPIFTFKFPRFAYRYKYEDGEYSCFSPFTEPAFLPGKFNYLPKEGYNLGMVNNLRKLAIKDFVHTRKMSDEVIAIDILYKESNSANIYSIKTIKRRGWDPNKWDEWNAVSGFETISPANVTQWEGTKGTVTGYMPITTEMIHAVLPANQLLRPWDNVPRKALAQEVIGNRLVYGNYLQNYNFSNLSNSNIKVDIQAVVSSKVVGQAVPEEIDAGLMQHLQYMPAKSVKSLRTYQIGVVYIDKYGRETPVFSEDKRGAAYNKSTSEASVYVDKNVGDKRSYLKAKLNNDPPSFATHFKFFIKETSNEYYNLCMDRWYDAEDDNIWLSFPSAERNKVDEETFLILKKEHDTKVFVPEPARYKIIAIENEAPRYIKLQDISMGGIKDQEFDPSTYPGMLSLAPASEGFPLEGQFKIHVHEDPFQAAGWKESLINQDISFCFFRVKSIGGTSLWYKLKQITFNPADKSYVLLSDKLFGGDMSHTSPDNTEFNRVPNCELQVMQKIPEDKAEFEGRFFVKILKDHTLIEKLGLASGITDNLVAVSSMKVQYIAPKETQAPGGFYGYGVGSQNNLDSISIDDKNNDDFWATPGLNDGANSPNGKGHKFWKMAGDDEHVDSKSASSGWFIDKVEAFRPFHIASYYNWASNLVGYNFGKEPPGSKDACQNMHSDDEIAWNHDAAGFSGYGDQNCQFGLLQVSGLDTYKQGSGYLGMKVQANDGSGHPSNHATSKGGKVSRSLGIDTGLNMIHLSYAGLNETGKDYGTKGSNNWNHSDWAFKSGAKHAADIIFMDKITQVGTTWRWKEDPGGVVYRTIAPDTSVFNSDYTSENYDRDTRGMDGEKGTFYYNYGVIADYIVEYHHRHWGSAGGLFSWEEENSDWQSRIIKVDGDGFGSWPHACWYPPYPNPCNSYWVHDTPAAGRWDAGGPGSWFGYVGASWDTPSHKRYPQGAYNWTRSTNRRRRFAIFAETAIEENNGVPYGLGGVGPHYYLPTNDPNLPPHFNYKAEPITEFPTGHVQAGTTFESLGAGGKAPGIRADGMYSGYIDTTLGYDFDKGDGAGVVTIDQIPQYKRFDANNVINGAGVPRTSGVPGSVTWEIVEQFEENTDKFSSTNPAIWETEPKEDVGLDIYHEVGQIYPVELNNETIEQFVGAVHININRNSYVQCWDPPYDLYNNPKASVGMVTLSVMGDTDVRVNAVKDNYVRLGVSLGGSSSANIPMGAPGLAHAAPPIGAYLIFHRADGSTTEAHVGYNTYTDTVGTWFELVGMKDERGVHNKQISLPWFNCYSFGNGVESDRVRDDYNQVTIDNGPKASTTMEGPYLEEKRKGGFIWSGLYNSTSGVNDTNQFIQAEKITKDVNPTYGSIQKLFARDSDLIAFCEDRVLNVQANKDTLFNADGNTNVVATNKVIGHIKPFSGDYGISLNPESFASDNHRAYFADASRGAILRLSQNGITNISDLGMSDWFSDELALTKDNKIIGSFDDNKSEYNITLKSIPTTTTTTEPGPCDTPLGTGLGSGSGSSSGTGEPGGQTDVRYYCNGTSCQPCNPLCQTNNPTWVTYATLTGCQNNCSPPPEAWKCVDGNCVYDANGNYSSYAACIQSTECSPPPEAWECVRGDCVNNGFGNYNSYATCMQSPGCNGYEG